jgi:signal transduction histidine kinase/ActR/RegA family two-component response regulator
MGRERGNLWSRGTDRMRLLVTWFVPPEVAVSQEGPRARLAVGISVLMAIVFVVLAATHFIARSVSEAIANLALSALMVGSSFAIKLTGRYLAVINATLGVSLAIVIFIGAGARGAGINAGTVALAEIPLFATLLCGPKIGAYWMALACAASAMLGVLGQRGLVKNQLDPEMRLFDDHVVLVVVTATLYLVAALYERGRAQGLSHIAALEADRRATEVEKMEAQAVARMTHSERMASLGRVAAATAHEINNPLSYVAHNVQYVLQRLEADRDKLGELAPALEEALDGVRRIQRIVSDLKMYAKPEDEAVGSVDLRRSLKRALKLAEGHIRSKAEVTLDFEPVPRVLGNDARLVQVFLNLLVNAAQALPEGRAGDNRIVVRTRLAGKKVCVEIEDSGAGIPADLLARIGEPFFTTRREGLGLGVAVCKTILARVGGELRFESCPGRTVAQVVLEIRESENPMPLESSSSPRALALVPARVLIVDDEPLVARAIRRNLMGHDVQIVASGREALALLDGGQYYDLVLCDLMMPDVSGMDVYSAIRDRHPRMTGHIVFMTGATFTDRAQDFRAALGDVFLEKPIDMTQLSAVIERCRRKAASA